MGNSSAAAASYAYEFRTRTKFVRVRNSGGKARVTEIPWGASAPQAPPRQHFKKFALPGKFFEMIKVVVVVNYFHY